MNASEVRISQETWDKNNLTRSQKRKLRKNAIKDYIKSKPYMKPITSDEFRRVGRFKTASEAWGFINGMVKRGEIQKEEVGKKRYGYIVNGGVNVVTPARRHGQAGEVKTSELEKTAKEFAWSRNSDSLRDFIKYLKSEGKNG